MLDDRNEGDPLLEDHAAPSHAWSIREDARVTTNANVETGSIAKLLDVGLGRSRIVPQPCNAPLNVTRHDARRIVVVVAARDDRGDHAGADRERDRGEEPQK